MKRKWTITVVIRVLSVFIAVYVYTIYKSVWQFENLEQRAQRAISASELQNWATNVLDHYPGSRTLTRLDLGANFPRRISELAPGLGPNISIFRPGDTNSSPYLDLYWRSGVAGIAGFEIGATNFVCHTNFYLEAHKWQNGVYFYTYSKDEIY